MRYFLYVFLSSTVFFCVSGNQLALAYEPLNHNQVMDCYHAIDMDVEVQPMRPIHVQQFCSLLFESRIPEVCRTMAYLYLGEQGTEPDLKEARRWFERYLWLIPNRYFQSALVNISPSKPLAAYKVAKHIKGEHPLFALMWYNDALASGFHPNIRMFTELDLLIESLDERRIPFFGPFILQYLSRFYHYQVANFLVHLYKTPNEVWDKWLAEQVQKQDYMALYLQAIRQQYGLRMEENVKQAELVYIELASRGMHLPSEALAIMHDGIEDDSLDSLHEFTQLRPLFHRHDGYYQFLKEVVNQKTPEKVIVPDRYHHYLRDAAERGSNWARMRLFYQFNDREALDRAIKEHYAPALLIHIGEMSINAVEPLYRAFLRIEHFNDVFFSPDFMKLRLYAINHIEEMKRMVIRGSLPSHVEFDNTYLGIDRITEEERHLNRIIFPQNKEKIIELLEGGANPNLYVMNERYTATQKILLLNDDDVTRALFKRGADLHKKDKNGYPGLYLAAQGGNLEALRLFVHKKPNRHFNLYASNFELPLHAAIEHGCELCAEFMVQNGARVFIRNRDGKLPLEMAKEANMLSLADMIRGRM